MGEHKEVNEEYEGDEVFDLKSPEIEKPVPISAELLSAISIISRAGIDSSMTIEDAKRMVVESI